MDDNFSQMIQSVMSDPEALKNIMSMAQGLMSDTGNTSSSKADEEHHHENIEEDKPSLASKLSHGNEQRIALNSALRPYLSPQRQKSADSLIKMLKMMKLADINKLFN